LSIGIIIFAFIVLVITALPLKKHNKIERVERAVYVAIRAWGGLFFGFFLSRLLR
jgi:hypothetical protein